MEEAFFRTHTYLVEHTDAPVRRTLMDEIDWSDRLIGIKGTRGVGKSTFLLQYAKEHFGPTDRKCLYVNMNNFYFQSRGIADLQVTLFATAAEPFSSTRSSSSRTGARNCANATTSIQS